jgi:hypothetical protein
LQTAETYEIASDCIDGDGTHRLDVNSSTRELAVCGSASLRTLHVQGGAELRTLDLSALPKGLVLHVSELPRLERVVLPIGPGCRLQLALGVSPRLRIDGSIGWIDARWLGEPHVTALSGNWNTRAAKLRPAVLQGAWIGPASEVPEDVQFACTLGERAESVDLSHCKALEVLLAEELYFVRREAQNRSLETPHERLRSKLLAEVRERERSPSSTLLAVMRALENDTELPGNLAGDFARQWSSKPVAALEALVELPSNVSCAKLWRVRLRLAHEEAGRPEDPRLSWAWELPIEQRDRGWLADLRIWRRCLRGSGAARSFEHETLRKVSDPDNLAAIALACLDPQLSLRSTPDAHAAQREVDFVSILSDQLHAGPKQGLYFRMNRKLENHWFETRGGPTGLDVHHAEVHPDDLRAMTTVLRALLRLRHVPEMFALRAPLARWIVRRLPNGTGVQTLATMHRLGSVDALAALSQILGDVTLPDYLRSLALTASLTPRESAILA